MGRPATSATGCASAVHRRRNAAERRRPSEARRATFVAARTGSTPLRRRSRLRARRCAPSPRRGGARAKCPPRPADPEARTPESPARSPRRAPHLGDPSSPASADHGAVLVAPPANGASGTMPRVYDFQWRLCDADGTNCGRTSRAAKPATRTRMTFRRRRAVRVASSVTGPPASVQARAEARAAEPDDIDLSTWHGSARSRPTRAQAG